MSSSETGYTRLTSSEVDHNVKEENGVGQAVESYPSRRQVIIEEGNGNRKHDQIGNQDQQHAQIPVEPEHTFHETQESQKETREIVRD